MATPNIATTVKLEYKSPDLLDFDPDNPRFAGLMKGFGPDKIQNVIFGEPYFASELVDSLVENGFIDYEPLVVKKNGNRFTVVEGNRRLAAIREIRGNLNKYAGRKDDLEKIPVLIFPDTPTEQQQNEMRVYLGVRHLLGFREWPPLSKAQYLENESQRQGLEQVLKETRLSKQEAKRFLLPFRLLHKAKTSIPKGEDFWVLGEALTRAGVKAFIELEFDPKTLHVISFDKKKFNQIMDDLYGPVKGSARDPNGKVVSDTRDLSTYANVLGSERASTVLHSSSKKTLGDAEIYVDTRDQSVKRLEKVSKQLGALVGKVTKGSKNPESSRLQQTYKQFEEAVKKFVSKE